MRVVAHGQAVVVFIVLLLLLLFKVHVHCFLHDLVFQALPCLAAPLADGLLANPEGRLTSDIKEQILQYVDMRIWAAISLAYSSGAFFSSSIISLLSTKDFLSKVILLHFIRTQCLQREEYLSRRPWPRPALSNSREACG